VWGWCGVGVELVRGCSLWDVWDVWCGALRDCEVDGMFDRGKKVNFVGEFGCLSCLFDSPDRRRKRDLPPKNTTFKLIISFSIKNNKQIFDRKFQNKTKTKTKAKTNSKTKSQTNRKFTKYLLTESKNQKLQI
jgi:hypothetical protein